MALEGEIEVGLRLAAGRVAGVRIASTRPDVARLMLEGRERAQAQKLVPLLFSICGRSQGVAAELACAAAAGEPIDAAALRRLPHAVGAEIVREYAWRMLLDWPQALGEPASPAAVAAARGSLAWQGDDADGSAAIAEAVYGMSATAWLALETPAAIQSWIAAGATVPARHLRRLCRDDEPGAAAQATVPLLPATDPALWVPALARVDDPDAARRPTRDGAAAETGALARRQQDPLIAAWLAAHPSRVPARALARLRELALLLAGRGDVALGACAVGPGAGLSWVENARGLLLHRVTLERSAEGDRVAQWRIVAPTDWNFHPEGALAVALRGQIAADPDQIKSHTQVLVHALDPCVSCRIGFDDA
ncbi:MAG: nickel-dependent hydrogenase large subunit [Burkholderiales bacterium]|nr:nickel-dependent hydrogenase large subunit [Burkholderiales bacterium]